GAAARVVAVGPQVGRRALRVLPDRVVGRVHVPVAVVVAGNGRGGQTNFHIFHFQLQQSTTHHTRRLNQAAQLVETKVRQQPCAGIRESQWRSSESARVRIEGER